MICRSITNAGGLSSFLALNDTPDSYVGQALRAAIVNISENGIQFVEGPEVNAEWYGASGSIVTTTLAAELTAGSGTATLTDASTFKAGQGMAIPGAGAAGAELAVVLSSVVGNTVTFTPATTTTVASGATVYHDDTVAIKAALATGRNVFLMAHPFNVLGGGQASIRLDGFEGQSLRGVNADYGYGARLINRSADKDVVRLVKRYTRLSDMTITQDLSFTPTAGAGVVLGDNTGSVTAVADIERVRVLYCYDGLRVEYASACYIDNFIVASPRRYGIYCTSPMPTGGNFFSNINCHFTTGGLYSGDVQAGIFIDRFDTNRWDNINCLGFPVNVHLRSDLGTINTQVFAGFTNENPTQWCIKLESTNYLLTSCGWYGGEFLTGGAYIGPNVEDCSFVGITAPQTSLSHVFDVYGKGTKISGVNLGVLGDTTTKDGVYVRSGADGTQVTGSSVKNHRYGITVDDGAQNTVIEANNFLGNNTAGSLISMVARGKSRINGNFGLDDYGDSIAAAPGYIGQEVFDNGEWFRANGTASVDNWISMKGGNNVDGGLISDPASSTGVDGGTIS